MNSMKVLVNLQLKQMLTVCTVLLFIFNFYLIIATFIYFIYKFAMP